MGSVCLGNIGDVNVSLFVKEGPKVPTTSFSESKIFVGK